jgi:hypothetical protein
LPFYIPSGESTALESLKQFCAAIAAIYGNMYLQSPNEEDITCILAVSEMQGFSGMMGSLDCMHWTWKNFPVAKHGQYSGKEGKPTVILEAVATHNLWIWHAFFGLLGKLNNITILDRSPIFQKAQAGLAVLFHYQVNGNKYQHGYYITNGIYPKYAKLIQSI